ncbi:hypothetical protein HEK616_51730 [Streptomyces nigrescens]|uniref:Uncharacterized protein n=1 Tax=Streptomyces nigrescens TaxID=1920 RepID=A0ABN6R159_STRNI|nr:hypothetical protein [Streptomyces nigrescens]BDM71686.1 hypothetical protein HEK616_51730 [Streptomyces nigrescens]
MTTAQRTTTVFLTVLCGLLLSIVGLTQQWPTWKWTTLAALLLVVPVAAFRIASLRRGSLPVSFEEQLTASPVERTECHVNQVRLPSLWDDYHFVFSATVRWYLVASPESASVLNPAGLAVEAVLNRARTITEKREPGQASLVQHELSGALSRMCPDPTGHLQAMAENISLTLVEQDQERLDRLAKVRKEKAVWEHQRKYEQSKRQYLGEDVLKDTGSAVVWWLAKNDEHVEKTVADLALLAQLTSAANDTDIPERLHTLVSSQLGEPATPEILADDPAPTPRERTAADHLSSFFDAMGFTEGDIRRPMLAKQFSDIIKQQNRHEPAEDLLRRFDPPATFTPHNGEESNPHTEERDEPPGTPLM